MRKYAAASVAAFGLSTLWSGAASAQATYNVVAGHEVRVVWAYSLNPDCSSLGQVVVRVTQPPQHGRVTIRNSRSFPNFASSNSHSVCNTRRVPGVEGYYRPASGYAGPDSVSFDVIYPSGNYQQSTANIQVR
jgi:hypothetical protein